MNSIKNLCTLIVVGAGLYYGYQYLTEETKPGPPAFSNRISEIRQGDPFGGPDKVLWAEKDYR